MNETTKQPADSEVQQSAPRMLRQPRIRLGAVIALAVAAGVIAWVVVGWASLPFTADALEEVRQAFEKAEASYWLSADGASLSAVLGSSFWFWLTLP